MRSENELAYVQQTYRELIDFAPTSRRDIGTLEGPSSSAAAKPANSRAAVSVIAT
jgi:hypothetical protein